MTTTRRYLIYWKESVKRFIGYLILLQLSILACSILFSLIVWDTNNPIEGYVSGLYLATDLFRLLIPIVIWSFINPFILLRMDRSDRYGDPFNIINSDSINSEKPELGIKECRISFIAMMMIFAIVCNIFPSIYSATTPIEYEQLNSFFNNI